MTFSRRFVTRFAPAVNARVEALTRSPRWGRLVGRGLTMMTYTGRRSGRTFTTPIGYRRKGDDITISVKLPDSKIWWRNFLGDGGPLSLHLDGTDRAAHAVAHRDPKGRVTVNARLSPS